MAAAERLRRWGAGELGSREGDGQRPGDEAGEVWASNKRTEMGQWR